MQESASTGTDRPVRVLQVTDPHLFADAATEIYGIRTAESFAAVVAQAAAAGPRLDAVLVTGDIGDDLSEPAYGRFRDTLAPLGVPVYCLPGNHDEPSTMARLFAGTGFQFGGSAMLGSWRLVLLDSHVPGEPFGRLGAEALARLERELASARDRPTLVAVHHPPMPVGSDWIDALGLQDGPALLELLARHPAARAVTSGHVHQAFEGRYAQLRLFTTPSTCAQFTPGTEQCVMDTRPPGWRRLELWPDGRIDTRVHWLEGWQPAARPVDSRAGDALGAAPPSQAPGMRPATGP
jgi:Icc protein